MDKLYTLNISYQWGIHSLHKVFPYSTLERAKAEIERLLPGTVWEDQKTYLVVDLHQYHDEVDSGGFVTLVDRNAYLRVFSISITWDIVDEPAWYRRATDADKSLFNGPEWALAHDFPDPDPTPDEVKAHIERVAGEAT